MGRHKKDHANLGENLEGSELERTNVERSDRSMSGTRTDRAAGSEGIEDPSIERSGNERMSGTEREGTDERSDNRQRSQGQNRQPGRERSEQRETRTSSTDMTE